MTHADGQPLSGAEALLEHVRARPAGSEVVYTFTGSPGIEERRVLTRRFGWSDFAGLFGLYLLNGVAFAWALYGLGRSRAEWAPHALPFVGLGGLWAVTALDLYGPAAGLRLHAAAEGFLFAGVLHLALALPGGLAGRHRRLAVLPWLTATGIVALYQHGLFLAETYVAAHLAVTTALGSALLVLLGTQLLGGERSDLGFWVAAAAFAAVAPAIVLTVAEVATGGRMPQNVVAASAFLLPLALVAAARPPKPRIGPARLVLARVRTR